jgi:hypothetical protein
MQNRTSLVIAHRLSTVQHADEVDDCCSTAALWTRHADECCGARAVIIFQRLGSMQPTPRAGGQLSRQTACG